NSVTDLPSQRAISGSRLPNSSNPMTRMMTTSLMPRPNMGHSSAAAESEALSSLELEGERPKAGTGWEGSEQRHPAGKFSSLNQPYRTVRTDLLTTEKWRNMTSGAAPRALHPFRRAVHAPHLLVVRLGAVVDCPLGRPGAGAGGDDIALL